MTEGKSDQLSEYITGVLNKRRQYEDEVLQSEPFQSSLRHLRGFTDDFHEAIAKIRLFGMRFSAQDNYLMFRFAPLFVESSFAVETLVREGKHNAARRELRFILEAAVKLSSRDFCPNATSFEDRLDGLADHDKRFEDYVATLRYFDEFEKPDDIKGDINSLYRELSSYVHASVPYFDTILRNTDKGEAPGYESVSALNRFNQLAMRVYDIVLVRAFHSVGLGMAGDLFTIHFDDRQRWRFHKAKYVSRLSRCFNYKHERSDKLS